MSGVDAGILHMFGWRRSAVAASIALNLFLLAYNGAQIMHLVTSQRGGRQMFIAVLTQAESRLSADDAARFRAVISREAPSYMREAERLGAARERISRIILAEPFDAPAARSEIATWRDAWFHFTGTFGNALVDAMGEISPKGRRDLIAGVNASRRSGSPPEPIQ